MLTRLTKGRGGFGKCWLRRGKRGGEKMLTMADEGGRVGLDPPYLADIICEQPLYTYYLIASLVKKLQPIS